MPTAWPYNMKEQFIEGRGGGQDKVDSESV